MFKKCDIMVQTNILTKPEYGYIVKCVLHNISSTKDIWSKYKVKFSEVGYENVSNKLSKITNMYPFLERSSKSKLAHYKINYTYWFEFISKHYFKHHPKAKWLNCDDKDLHMLLKEYLINNLNNPVPILELIHRFLVFNGTAKEPIPNVHALKDISEAFFGPKEEHETTKEEKIWYFRYWCDVYIHHMLLYLDKKQINEILGVK